MSDLISREALKKNCAEVVRASNNSDFIPCPTWNKAMELIDNAPTVEPFERIGSICEENCGYNPQGCYARGFIDALDKAFSKFDANCTYSGDRVLQKLEKLKEEARNEETAK